MNFCPPDPKNRLIRLCEKQGGLFHARAAHIELNWTKLNWTDVNVSIEGRGGPHTHTHTYRKLLFSWLSPLPCQWIWSTGFLSRSQLSRTELREWEEGEEGRRRQGGTERERGGEGRDREREKYSHTHTVRGGESERSDITSPSLSLPLRGTFAPLLAEEARVRTGSSLSSFAADKKGKKQTKGAGPANRRGYKARRQKKKPWQDEQQFCKHGVDRRVRPAQRVHPGHESWNHSVLQVGAFSFFFW